MSNVNFKTYNSLYIHLTNIQIHIDIYRFIDMYLIESREIFVNLINNRICGNLPNTKGSKIIEPLVYNVSLIYFLTKYW